jgi:hypothetical protein
LQTKINDFTTNVKIKHSNVRIPEVFWKVVFERETGRGLIFITFNSPYPAKDSNVYVGLENLKNARICSDCQEMWENINTGRPQEKMVERLKMNDIYGKTYCCDSIHAVFKIFDCSAVNELSYLPKNVQESNIPIKYSGNNNQKQAEESRRASLHNIRNIPSNSRLHHKKWSKHDERAFF